MKPNDHARFKLDLYLTRRSATRHLHRQETTG